VLEAERLGARAMLWRLQVELGRLHQSQARRIQADHAYSAAEAIVSDLATTVPDEHLRKQFVQSALAFLPRRRPLSSRRRIAREFAGLTERERQVAVLVARGLSNREAAEALVVSERTVETHVAHIMAKLGLNSRVQIATWTTEKGLDRQEE
jgi:DNA-binding NarL/FixJ family response regulator